MRQYALLIICFLLIGCQTSNVTEPIVEDDPVPDTSQESTDSPIEEIDEGTDLLDDEEIEFDVKEFEDW